MKNILEFDSLYLEFGLNNVLQDVYMKCEQGEVVGLIGRNGSGKSCLMQIVFGSLKAYQQSVRINGAYVLNTNIPRGLIHYLPQDSFIPKGMKVKTVLKQYEVNEKEFISVFPFLSNSLHQKIEALAGGELRLLEIFIVLKRKGLFCILDEPFSNLMPLHIESVMQLIQETKVSKGIIITDHLYRYMLDITDKMYLLNNGKTFPIQHRDELVQFGYLSAF